VERLESMSAREAMNPASLFRLLTAVKRKIQQENKKSPHKAGFGLSVMDDQITQ